jgi:hypothetical protein
MANIAAIMNITNVPKTDSSLFFLLCEKYFYGGFQFNLAQQIIEWITFWALGCHQLDVNHH